MSRWWCWGKKGGTQEFNFFTVCHERVNIFAIWLLNKHLIGIQTIWISQEWIRHIRQTHLDMFLIARLNILSIMPWTWLFRHKNYSRCVKGLGVITVTVRSGDLACVESHQEALRVVLQKKGGLFTGNIFKALWVSAKSLRLWCTTLWSFQFSLGFMCISCHSAALLWESW